MHRLVQAVRIAPAPRSWPASRSRRRGSVAALLLLATTALGSGLATAAEPGEPVDPVQPVQPVEPVEPVEPVQPVQSVQSVEPGEPAGATPAAGIVTPTILAGDIAPFEVVYDVGNNLITAGSARLSLARDGEDWVYVLSTRPTGVFKLTGKGRIRETSVLRVVPSDVGAADAATAADGGGAVQLQPQSYSYRQDDETRRSVDAAFDWDARTLRWTYRGEETDEVFADPVLDRLSVTLAVMNFLRQGFEELELEVFDSGRIKTMRFVNEGQETIDTKMGKVETIRVRGRNADNGSRSTRTWFAPSLDYVPVRIEQRKRDELVARMNLLKLKNRVTDIELVDPDELDESPSQLK